MIFVHPDIEGIINITGENVPTVVVESPDLLRRIISNIYQQINGNDGEAVLSENNKSLVFSKSADLLSSFIPFEINRKPLVTKIISKLESKSSEGDFYLKSAELLSEIEKYLNDLSFDFFCNIVYTKLNIGALLKAVGPEIVDDYDTVSEKILDYMELVREFDADKLFITVNMRSFVDTAEITEFMHSVVSHGFKVLMFENKDYDLIEYENRITIDKDLCQF